MISLKILITILLILGAQSRRGWYDKYGSRKITYPSYLYAKDYFRKNCEKYNEYNKNRIFDCDNNENYVEKEDAYYEYEPEKSKFYN